MSHNQLLSREDVINAYKFILGRAPESEQVIDETPWIPDHRRAASRVPDVERIWYAVSVLGGLDAWKTRAQTGITVSQAISRSGGVGAQHWEASRDSGAPASAKPAASCDAASRIGEAPALQTAPVDENPGIEAGRNIGAGYIRGTGLEYGKL